MKIPQTKRYSIYKNLVLQDERSKKLNFEPDGRKHYVYRITDYSRTKEQHYVGSRTSKKDNLIEDFWSYRTSSKHNILNENKKEQYKIKILKVFNNPGDKMVYEAFLHQFYNVKLHKNFWNKSNQTPFGFDTTGCKFSDDVNKSKGRKGLKRSIEHIEIISKTHKNKIVSDETREKLRKASLGRTLSDECKRKISEAISDNNYQVAKISIYNKNDELQEVVTTPFGKWCKINDFPENMLKISYKNNGKRIYTSKYGKSVAIKKGYEKYIGWYAIKEEKE